MSIQKKLMDKIKNKEDLTPNELMTIERSLRLYEINDTMLNYQIGLDKDNKYELTETLKEQLELDLPIDEFGDREEIEI